MPAAIASARVNGCRPSKAALAGLLRWDVLVLIVKVERSG